MRQALREGRKNMAEEIIVRIKETVEYIGHLDCENADPHNAHEWYDENGQHYCYGVYREEK